MHESSVPAVLTESAVRSHAARAGYRLIKSRSRSPQDWEYGTYGLVEFASNAVAMPSPIGYTLTDVAEHLQRLTVSI